MKCEQCGVCCKLFAINLSEKEYKSGRYRTEFEEFGIVEDFEEAEMTGANIIRRRKDGSCWYLKDGKCSIHNRRPAACRKFFCDSDNPDYQDMIKEIKLNKKI